MIRVGRSDPVRMEEIWSSTRVRDALECYVRILKEEATEAFMHQQMLYVQGGMKKAPKLPDILKARSQRRRPVRTEQKPKAPERPAFLDALDEKVTQRR